MAIKLEKVTSVTLTDDLDGTTAPDVATHKICVDGEVREIELSPANLKVLQDALAPFWEKGRKARSGKTRAGRSGRSEDASTRKFNQQAREWLTANRPELLNSPTGRLSKEAKRTYLEAISGIQIIEGGGHTADGVPAF